MKVLTPRLAGVKEAADFFGVKRSNFIRDYAKHPEFPKPIAVLACGTIWLLDDLKGFKEEVDRGWIKK